MRSDNAGKVILIRDGGSRHSTDHPLGLLFMIALQENAHRRAPNDPSLPLVSVYLDEAHMYFNTNFTTFVATCRKNASRCNWA